MKPPLEINPIDAEYYCIHFKEWNGSSVRLYSGKTENEGRKAEIELVLNHSVELVSWPAEKVREMNRERFGIGASSVVELQEGEEPGGTRKDGGVSGQAEAGAVPGPTLHIMPRAAGRSEIRPSTEPSIIQFVNRLIDEAFQDRATDIHIEPFENRLDVRYRIDGVLHQIPVPSAAKDLHRSIVSRLKILSHLDIAEQRLPQDGRFRFKLSDAEELDIRVSILPTPFGETVNLRLLTTQVTYTGLASLGLSDIDRGVVEGILERPHGVVLVTGPTGSGKTTTLYAFLSLLNERDRKIITIEEPIEYQIPGISQIQVHPKIGLTFAHGLRSMLRHDPDIMMVGEIRDRETAETTIQVALTGHLVFSTVHTNDAPSTPTRLINMGVEPYLVASSLECVIAQRLIRLICDHCREEVPSGEKALHREVEEHIRKSEIPWDGRLCHGRGCDECKNTGYRGRTAIYEVLPVFEKMQSLVLEQAPANVMRAAAKEESFRPMQYDGLVKVAGKRTTYEEVLRVTRKESY